MIGPIEKHLLKRIRKEGAIHLTLIDPEKVTPSSASRLAKKVEAYVESWLSNGTDVEQAPDQIQEGGSEKENEGRSGADG